MRTRAEILAQLRSIRHDRAGFQRQPDTIQKKIALGYLRGAEKSLKWALEVPHSKSRQGPK